MSKKFKFSKEYRRIEDLPVTVAIDFRQFTGGCDSKKFEIRDPDDIFSYDDSLERRIIERCEQAKVPDKKEALPFEPSAEISTSDRIRRLTESLSAVTLRKASPPLNEHEAPSPPPPPPSSLLPDTTTPNSAKSLESQATELSQLYLPDDTADRRRLFTEIYIASRSLAPPPGDLLVLRAYFLYDGQVEEAVRYLRASAYLGELGFQEEQISTSLLLHKNNVDEALDYLMKNN